MHDCRARAPNKPVTCNDREHEQDYDATLRDSSGVAYLPAPAPFRLLN